MNQQLIKWLPYPEYKPSNGRPVLVTYNWKSYIFDEDDFEVGIGEYWNNGSGFGKWDKYVIAFTTLPQPYNVEENMK